MKGPSEPHQTQESGDALDDSPTTAPRAAATTHALDEGDPLTELAADASERMIGRVLGGQYRIEGHLGSGGFGDVYRAVQEKTGQTVALKLLKPRYGKGAPTMERQLARFRREMRVGAELHHPHIVRLIDSGETERGLLFSVFEYVPGATLAELLREKGALPVRTAVELMTQVLDALVCAHGKGVIHRDLKPSNIMVSTTGSRPQITVLDFGISAFLDGVLIDEFRILTMTREVLGTPAYAAPEQLRGETPSAKSDLYAWGLVLLECITGRRAFDGASPMEVAHRQLSTEPVPLPERLQSHWLGTMIRWVTEKDVSSRAGEASLVMEHLGQKRMLGDLVDGHGYLIDDDRSRAELASPAAITQANTGSVSPGERRQVTALCCAISLGPTNPSVRPEELDQALGDAHLLCVQVATRFGGTPAGNLGGQVLIYFGFPRASDTDARRSAIVALEIAAEIRRRNERSTIPLELRAGIHTGVVTTMAREMRPSSPVFGVTPGRAVQLALEAPAQAIVVSAETHAYVAHSFELEPAASSRGETIFRLLAERRVGPADGGTRRSPFVGRDAELGALISAWQSARRGQGGAILIRGDAGLGKSRLARELRQRFEETGAPWLEARCLPELQNTPLHPLVDLVVHEIKGGAAAPLEKARRLDARLGELGLSPEAMMPLLCPWLGIPLPPPYLPATSSPQRQKTLALAALADFIIALAEAHSSPILIEDLHWSDPSTRELVELLARRMSQTRSLLILTCRPGVSLSLPRQGADMLDLKPLSRAQVLQIVAGSGHQRGFSATLAEEVVQRSDGIPLFVEEMVRFLKETATPDERDQDPAGEVPRTLRDLLTGRLDRLGAAKETAQIASVIGREFDYRLLSAVVRGDEAALLADIEKMVSAEILVRRRHVDSPVYAFRHVLIRDAAYETLLDRNRQGLHRRIGETLTAEFPELAEANPEMVAAHFTHAGLVEDALVHWLAAGRRGLDRAANRETIAHLRRALALLPGLADGRERIRWELDLQSTLAPALMAIEGWASPATGAACRRALELSHMLGDRARRFHASWGLWSFQFVGGDLEPAHATACDTLAMAKASEEKELLLAAHHALGFTELYRANLAQARHHGTAGLALFDLERERGIARDLQLSPSCSCAYFRAASEWMMGHYRQAEEDLALMYDLARDLGHLPTTASVMGFALFLHHYQQDVARTEKTAAELFALASAQGFQNWVAVSSVYGAWARAKTTDLEGGIQDLRQGIEIFRSLGARLTLVGDYAMLGEALLMAGRPEEALAALSEGIVEAESRSEHLCAPELHRLRGKALAHLEPDAAEPALWAALNSARVQGAHTLSLRASLDLAGVLPAARRSEAVDLLVEELDWFPADARSPDLARARVLLGELSL